jgi:hypothetical protein
MNSADAIEGLRKQCNDISRIVTSMHREVGSLGNPDGQAEILRALFELTRQVEVVKKHLIRLQKGDNSTVL